MIAASQLDVLIERAVPFTGEEDAAFNAITLPTAEVAAEDPGADIATAARRVAAWG